ncbi:hypothetical protein RRG39_02320 [Mycoplasmopsis cynos]|uniref:hypothetical protein n=1 Tax=Mycoplasmopsis cynos TaxID=171284 RepID=UPI002AFEB395|nr:hypothetical protein [Mycoplasmopsis cynos]WQQ16598.1 hypothetical protein RRG39_02320 [Mycoplasmopsis cynos]
MKAKKLLLLSSLTFPLIISSCSTQNSTNNNNQPNDSKVNQEETITNKPEQKEPITSNPNPLNEPDTPKEGDENSKTQSDSINKNKTGKNV